MVLLVNGNNVLRLAGININSILIGSPRWSSGYPRILLALVPEFDSHRDEILTLFVKMRKKDQLFVESA